MKQLVDGIARALVDNPDKVLVEEIGKVIGKKGRIAKSIRTVLKSVSNKKKVNVTLEIVED